jgi:hypothetical protein
VGLEHGKLRVGNHHVGGSRIERISQNVFTQEPTHRTGVGRIQLGANLANSGWAVPKARATCQGSGLNEVKRKHASEQLELV